MKKLFKPGLLIVGVVFVLAAIFAGIMYFQGESPALPRITPGTQTATPVPAPASSVETGLNRIEERAVDVAFKAEEQVFEFNKIPLYRVTYQNEQPIEVVADGDLAKTLVDKLPAPTSARPAGAAKLEKPKNGFARIVRGELGYAVDKNKTLEALEMSITQNPDAKKLEIGVIMGKTEGKAGFASKVKEMGFNHLIASFSTVHPDHADDEGRNVNLGIAAERIDGLIIPPGGKFSFNKVVGPRTSKYGFKNAGVISQGRVIPGMGGGICQVSTTLYRGILMSGMKIDERHNHSIYDGINYAQRGLDAAVAWGYKDFCFTNNLDIPILLACRSGKGSVELEIYAEKKPFDEVILETRNEVKHPFQVQKKTNSSLKKGEVKIVHPGVNGYSIETYRRITQSGKTKEERLSKDRYQTYSRIEESNN
ncbi:MAG: VanW family protein [Candidatus Riflebacteria bacterium]|nr:VanW family protein [Candidatus Riflebacteria bacterium]